VASSFIRRPDATCEEELSQFIVDDETLGGGGKAKQPLT
jgi:hypothetical protein